MSKRKGSDPSPIRSGMLHAGLSLLVFGGAAGAAIAGIHVTGDAASASPNRVIALFETGDTPAPGLKNRLNDTAFVSASTTDETLADAATLTGDTPDLGVEYTDYAGNAAATPTTQADQGSAEAGMVRINGHLLRPGESLSGVTSVQKIELVKAPVAGLHEAGRLPKVSDDGRSPADIYARPFTNAQGKPTISIVVGGLGINATHTRSAIEELPPEVTLSFVSNPKSNGPSLQQWVNRARAAGHEVLIEVPMQPYDYGRYRALPGTLSVSNSVAQNTQNLHSVLGKATGYYGVTNYQGSRFATNTELVSPIMAELKARGIAFVDDGSLARSAFRDAAASSGIGFASADRVIDANADAIEIETQLLALETIAKETGAAHGTGFNYPITVDTLKVWIERLPSKGIILAPASSRSAAMPGPVIVPDAPVRTGALPTDTLDKAG